MNDAAELERKRLERFLAGGGKKAAPVIKTTTTASPKSSPTTTTASSLGSSPSYKHEEKRKWEIKQERGRAEFAAAASATGKKHLEMEDSAAEAAARRSVAGVSGGGAAVNVESYEERERRRRAEWKRQASPSLALLDLLEGDADDQEAKPQSRSSPAPVKVAAPVKGSGGGGSGSGVRSASEEAALKELLNFNADNAQQTTKKKSEASSLRSSSSSSPSSSSKDGVRLSPRLEDKQQTADTFAQIGNVLNSLNDLLDDGDAKPSQYSSASTSVGAVDTVYVSGLPAHARSSDYPAAKSESGGSGRANAKPKTKEERRLAKEARRPEWAQTLYQEFEEDEAAERDYEYVDQQLWRVDLDQEELESKEFVKDAQDGIQKLEAVSAMLEPDMDVDDFDEERFSLGIKEFVYSGKKTIRYIKRKSKQGSVRMAGEAKKFVDDSVALMDTARDYKTSRTEKAKAKFSRTVRKVKEGAQKLTKTVSSAVEDEVERMRELREKIRAAERDRREREQQEAEARESRKAAAEREASVTRLSFDLDQFLYHVKKIEDDAFRFDYGGAVELLKRVRDVKESVPVLLAYLSGAAVKQFSHLNAEITEIATATARFVKDWQAGGSSKAENMRQTGNIVKLSRKFQQHLMDLILFI